MPFLLASGYSVIHFLLQRVRVSTASAADDAWPSSAKSAILLKTEDAGALRDMSSIAKADDEMPLLRRQMRSLLLGAERAVAPRRSLPGGTPPLSCMGAGWGVYLAGQALLAARLAAAAQPAHTN
jgi:hypothetical protein